MKMRIGAGFARAALTTVAIAAATVPATCDVAPNMGDNIASVTFLGTGGATETFTLVAGTNVRDFFSRVFCKLDQLYYHAKRL
jgi:hypothetical protein